ELALVRQQFEFFETAFLMMIAFYFGDKSLRYLQKRWRDPNLPGTERPSSVTKGGTDDTGRRHLTIDPSGPKDPVFFEDQEYLEDEVDFSKINDTPPSSALDLSKDALTTPKEGISTKMGVEYVQIMDNLHHKV